MSVKRVWIPSPNYRIGRRATPRLLVLHTTEGARTIESLGNFFANPENEVSSHAGADDKIDTVGTYVRRENTAWTQGSFNDSAVSMELCAFSGWPISEWLKHPNILANCAAWLAEEARIHDIPLVALSRAQAQGTGRGVCQHVDLGSAGGGHSDCGPGFPMGQVLQMARDLGQAPLKVVTWYFLQDVTASRLARGQRMYYGGWRNLDGRDEHREALEKGFGHVFRPFRDDDFDSPYFLDNSAYVREIYGGWLTEHGRDRKREQLEAELGHTLRPFSEVRNAAQGGVPWGCKNLERP